MWIMNCVAEDKYQSTIKIEDPENPEKGHFKVSVSENETYIQKIDSEGKLDGEATFDWNRSKIKNSRDSFDTVLWLVIENNFDI